MQKPEIILNKLNWVNLLIFLIILSFCLFFPLYFQTTLYLEMKAEHQDQVQVYYNLGAGFNEQDSVSELTGQMKKVKLSDSDYYAYTITIPAAKIKTIRLDPLMQEGPFCIRKLSLENRFFQKTIDLDLLATKITGDREIQLLDSGCPGIHGLSVGGDPSIIIFDNQLKNSIPLYLRFIVALTLFLVYYIVQKKYTLILQRIKTYKFILLYYLLGIVIASFLAIFWPHYMQTTLYLEIETDSPNQLQLYYDLSDRFTEEDSFNSLADYTKKQVIAGTNYVAYYITLPAKKIEALRLDPLMQVGAFSIRHVELRNTFHRETIRLEELTEETLKSKDIRFITTNAPGIRGYSYGPDPGFIIYNKPLNNTLPVYIVISVALLFLIMVHLLVKYYPLIYNKAINNKKLTAFLLGTLVILVFFLFLFQHVSTLLYIEIEAEHYEELQVYYVSEKGVHQDDSIDEKVDPIVKSRLFGKSYWIFDEKYYEYYLTLPAKPIKGIRIDLMKDEGPFSIRYISLHNMFFSKTFDLAALPDQVTRVDDIDFKSNTQGKLAGISTGEDPHFTLYDQELNNRIPLYLRLLLAFIFSLLWYYFLKSYEAIRLKVADFYATMIKTPGNLMLLFMFLFVSALILSMAVTSGFDGHPDEYLNFKAAEYFRSNWIRPEVGHEDLISHYRAVWGLSRLHYSTSNLDYFLIGKASLYVFDFIVDNIVISARLFNLLLFSVFLLLLKSKYRISLIFILIIPQVWYIFSYVNATDSYALLLSMLTVFVLLDEKNLLNNFFNSSWKEEESSKEVTAEAANLLAGSSRRFFGSRKAAIYWRVFMLGTLLALIASSKSNYLAFVGFAFLYLVISYFDRAKLLHYAKKIGIIVLIMAAWLLLFFAYDLAIHGFDKNEQIEETREDYSWYYVKPSVEKSLQEQGVEFTELITEHNWHTYTYKSFVGYYAYMSKFSGNRFYILFGVFLSLLIFSMISAIYTKGDLRDRLLLTAGLATFLALIFVSYYMSWVFRFQPQGRYLFPGLAILSIYYGRYQHFLNRRIILALTLILFALALYSYVFTGLYGTPGWYIIDRL